MPLSDWTVVVMAAGKGTRMRSEMPKVLHELGGRCLIDHVLDLALDQVAPADVVVVVGHGAEQLTSHLARRGVRTALQEPQLGTGDAVRVALECIGNPSGGGRGVEPGSARPDRRSGKGGKVMVLSGDVPLLRQVTIDRLMCSLEGASPGKQARPSDESASKPDAVLLSACLEEPGSYGRVLRQHPAPSTSALVKAIVEARDADAQTLAGNEVNAGVYAFRLEALRSVISELRPDNAQGEYYLTDLVSALRRRDRAVHAVLLDDAEEMLGVNTRQDLSRLARALNRRITERLMSEGVTIIDPSSTWIDVDCQVGRDAVLEPGVVLRRGARIGEGARIGAHSVVIAHEVAAGDVVAALTMLG